MKVPPRSMFWCQVNYLELLTKIFTDDFQYKKIVATVVAGTVQLGVQSWMFTNIPGICSMDPLHPQKDG
jgi:hypothetical protein